MTNNVSQFVTKFFAALCVSIYTKLLTTTEYHSQATKQTKRFNKTLVARLLHYFGERQSNWDLYVQPVVYGYNAVWLLIRVFQFTQR